jgi:hypothetical protein
VNGGGTVPHPPPVQSASILTEADLLKTSVPVRLGVVRLGYRLPRNSPWFDPLTRAAIPYTLAARLYG